MRKISIVHVIAKSADVLCWSLCGEEIGEDTAEEQGDTSGSGETDTKEDDSGSQEDAPENGSKEMGEYGSGMQGICRKVEEPISGRQVKQR